MSAEERFEKGKDYDVPLLRLLARLPDGEGDVSYVRSLFEEQYGQLIPEAHQGERISTGESIWWNNVCWSRERLKELGFLDSSTRGVWRITPQGRAWLETNPDARWIKASTRHISSRPQVSPTPRPTVRTSAAPGITLEMLEQTRKSMPKEQFRVVWGELYDGLLAVERAKSVSKVDQAELGRRTRRWLDDVHAFLQGRSAVVPAADILCDWIQVCYTFELYREASALLNHIPEDEVDPVVFKRSKRIADVCRSKITG